ncbi:histidine phosphatase family protein [Alteromonadaceae bacterium BrNp21-10]|nr:histidine phosphatase family protein [Alteromonadaceae bacterium BrNp21-10]
MTKLKTIHLLRHGKSSWQNANIRDKQRPLNQRGIRSCSIMAAHLASLGLSFEHIYCSSAVRAQSTIELINEHWPQQNLHWKVDEALYTFSSRDLLHWCRQLPESITEILIIGHNPGFTDFCNQLSNASIDNILTCGYVQMHCDVQTWSKLATHCATLQQYISPKML